MIAKKDLIAPASTEAETKTKITIDNTHSNVIKVADGTYDPGECEIIKTVRFGVTEAGAVIIPCIDRPDFKGGHKFYCSFCKRYHLHGLSAGHRCPHCRVDKPTPLSGKDYYVRHMTKAEEARYRSMSPKKNFWIEGLKDWADTQDREDPENEHRPLCVQLAIGEIREDLHDFELLSMKSRLVRATITQDYHDFMIEELTLDEMCERGFITCQTRDELNDNAREAWVDEQENQRLDMCADGGD